MVTLWKVLGFIVAVFGTIGSFFLGGIETAITGIIYSAFGAIVCFTISHVVSAIDDTRDCAKFIAEAMDKAPSHEPAPKASAANNAPPSYFKAASGDQKWTCKKCLASNPATSNYCKECGAYK